MRAELPVRATDHWQVSLRAAAYDSHVANEPPDNSNAFPLGDPDEFLDAVQTVMRTFGSEGIRWRAAISTDGLEAARIVADPKPYMARAGLMTTAAVIRWAAHETGRSEDEILDELRRSLKE